MSQIRLVADSSCDLLSLDGVDFVSVPLTLRTETEEFRDDARLDVDAMVATLRATKGRSYSACPNVADWEKAFGESGDVLAFTITSSLSGSYGAACVAKQSCEERDPSRRIRVVDTLSAGPETMLLLEKAASAQRGGASFDEVCRVVEELRRRTHLLFSLESMHNLAQNGRVSKLAATAAGVLGIRAVGQASAEGTLEMLGKCRGERKTQEFLLQELERLGYKGGSVRIGHCGNAAFSLELYTELRRRFPNADVRRYLSGFPEYVATLAFGEEITPQQGKLSLQTARQRMNWRIALGANRIIGPEHFVTNPKLGELDTIARAQLQNAVEALNAAAASRVWQDLVRQIQSNPQNDPALYYTLARCFLNTFYGDLTWDERRTRQCRNWLEQVRHCWQLPQLNELVEQAIAEELQTQQKELDNQTARPVRMALNYIAENYAQKIGLDEIAEMLQMNSSYFSTLFKKETGRNFQNYLTEYRIEKAKELLRTTNETMMSVAEQVGYQDTRYFSQCFVKVVGVKPSLYRKMYS